MKTIENDEDVLFFNKVSCKLMYQDDGVHILMNGLDYRYFDENEPELVQENNDIYIIINGDICDALVLGNLVQKMIDKLVETNQIVKIKIIFENILCNFYIKTLIKWLKCIVNCKCKSIFKNILQEIYNEYDFTSASNKLALLQDLENYL